MPDDNGDRFQQNTKYFRDDLTDGYLDWSTQPSPYKEYPNAHKIELYHPDDICKISLTDAIKSRRSVRNYSKRPISREELSFLIWASNGIERAEEGKEFRTAPSAGALYPIETYVIVNRVDGLEQGVYHYNVRRHALEALRLGNFGKDIALAALDQRMCLDAAVVFVWTAVFERSKWKYKQRGYRYMYMDAGHIAENLALASIGLGMGSCQIGALYDEEVNSIIEVDGVEESVLYMSSVGPLPK
jgi:SagB-type dehydrogenase family enzyme